MKEKDFKSLSTEEQKKEINEFIISWQAQDSNNRSALVILGDRKNKEDSGQSSFLMLGPGGLIMDSLKTALSNNKPFESIIIHSLTDPLRKLFSLLKK